MPGPTTGDVTTGFGAWSSGRFVGRALGKGGYRKAEGKRGGCQGNNPAKIGASLEKGAGLSHDMAGFRNALLYQAWIRTARSAVYS